MTVCLGTNNIVTSLLLLSVVPELALTEPPDQMVGAVPVSPPKVCERELRVFRSVWTFALPQVPPPGYRPAAAVELPGIRRRGLDGAGNEAASGAATAARKRFIRADPDVARCCPNC